MKYIFCQMHGHVGMKLKTFMMIGALTLLGGCAAVAVTGIAAGSVVGVVALQERGISGTLADMNLSSEVHKKLLALNPKYADNITYIARDNRVLIAGYVATAEEHINIIKSIWGIEKIRDVYDSLKVGRVPIENQYSDTAAITNAKGILLKTRGVNSLNYSITSWYGDVYVMGYATTELEKKKVEAALKKSSKARSVTLAIYVGEGVH